jgi:hypothetical protein
MVRIDHLPLFSKFYSRARKSIFEWIMKRSNTLSKFKSSFIDFGSPLSLWNIFDVWIITFPVIMNMKEQNLQKNDSDFALQQANCQH